MTYGWDSNQRIFLPSLISTSALCLSIYIKSDTQKQGYLPCFCNLPKNSRLRDYLTFSKGEADLPVDDAVLLLVVAALPEVVVHLRVDEAADNQALAHGY